MSKRHGIIMEDIVWISELGLANGISIWPNTEGSARR